MSNVILRRRKLGKGSTKGIMQFSTKGITIIRNWKDRFPEGTNLVFRWGCTSNVPQGSVVINTSASIHWCSDKRQGRLDMQAAGVPVPKTWSDYNDVLDVDSYIGNVVVRPARHAQGRNLFVFDMENLAGTDAMLAKCEQLGYGEYYISQLVNKVSEYRVFVCQNRVVWVAKKTPGNPDQVAWNVAQGGRFDNVRWSDWPLSVVKAALAAAKVAAPIGLDFCGVDVMMDAEGKPYVLEVNSAPSQTSPYRQSCVAKAFDYIIENGKQHFDDVPDSPRRTYKSYIHPAIRA